MERPTARFLDDGRLHLSHGPIDLIIGGGGEAENQKAIARFETILGEIASELDLLRAPISQLQPSGNVALRMWRAGFAHRAGFVTPMAAVAGAVADEMLSAMDPIRKTYVNNGGDIALYLPEGAHFELAMSSTSGHSLGQISVSAKDGIGGIATSGRHGRSFSMGIADSVTVLARNAASADVAATLIANAVDLPGHPAVTRQPANALSPDSDLGTRLVTTDCARLSQTEVAEALEAGVRSARAMIDQEHIKTAALFLQGAHRIVGARAHVALETSR